MIRREPGCSSKVGGTLAYAMPANAALRMSVPRLDRHPLSLFDANGAAGDSVRNTCTEALAARDITPNLWKLVEVE